MSEDKSLLMASFAGSYTCGNCNAVVAFEGEIPADCLRCGATLHAFSPAVLSDDDVQARCSGC